MRGDILPSFIFWMAMTLLNGALLAQTTPYGSYLYRFSDREGRPSKCDCDYHEEVVTFSDDGTFTWKTQRGRLDPKMEFVKGTWTMGNDSLVELHGTHRKGSIFPIFGKEVEEDEWIAAECHRTLVIGLGRFRLHEWGGGKEYAR